MLRVITIRYATSSNGRKWWTISRTKSAPIREIRGENLRFL